MTAHLTMTAPSLTWKQIRALDPCAGSLPTVRAKIKAAYPDYRNRALTLADAASAGVSFGDLVWVASRADARRSRLFAADCAAHVSHLATDPRSHEAIRCARLFARGEIGAEGLSAAYAAARAAAYAAAAYAAAYAAAEYDTEYAAAYPAECAADARAKDAASAAERAWQRARLLEWFSDDEPEDWPIHTPEAAKAA